MKYGNTGDPVIVEIPAKYAYVPFGKSGVLPNLPLFSSRSPALL